MFRSFVVEGIGTRYLPFHTENFGNCAKLYVSCFIHIIFYITWM